MNRSNDDDSSTSSESSIAWIPWFCGLKGNEFFCEVEHSFINDGFNLTGLSSQIPYYNWALDLILDLNSVEPIPQPEMDKVEADAEQLYGLIHARYILTTRGLSAMLDKFKKGSLGRCPRVLCNGQPTLPMGLTDSHNLECVRLYCPMCDDIYTSKVSRHAHIDGAYFGCTFPHLFFLTYPEYKPSKNNFPYVPRVFGFKVNEAAYEQSLYYKNVSKNQKVE